jgi:hypothetical protein
MAFQTPYNAKNFIGLHVDGTAATTWVLANKWDTTHDGLGTPQMSMTYYDTTANTMNYWNGAAWAAMGSGGGGPATALGEVWADSLNGDDGTADGSPSKPYASLSAAYTYAKTLTPGGNPLSQTNRAVLRMKKGIYYLTANLNLDTNYIDITGEGVCSWRTGTYPSTIIVANGFTLSYSALNIVVDTLTIVQVGTGPECTCLLHAVTASGMHFEYFKNIYFYGMGSLSQMRALVIDSTARCYSNFENCHTSLNGFLFGGGFQGTAKNCSAGNYSFSGWKDTSSYAINSYPAECNGTLEDCSAGEYSFGAIDGNIAGGFSATLSGSFTRCIGGAFCFGVVSGNTDTSDIDVTGTFNDCIAQMCSFAYTDLGTSTFEGMAKRCFTQAYSFGNTAVNNEDTLLEECSIIGIETAGPLKLYNGTYIRNKFVMPVGELGPVIYLDGSGACFYDNDVYGPSMTTGIDAAVPLTIKMAHCRMNAGFGLNVSNDLMLPYNLIDSAYTLGGY